MHDDLEISTFIFLRDPEEFCITSIMNILRKFSENISIFEKFIFSLKFFSHVNHLIRLTG